MQKAIRSAQEMQRLAREIAAGVSAEKHATVFALSGPLGAGKTTFVQGFSRAFGVREKVQSPTFVILRLYGLPRPRRGFRRLAHLDCYRLSSRRDLRPLGLDDLFRDPASIVLIEWADRVRNAIPKSAHWIRFSHRPGASRTVSY